MLVMHAQGTTKAYMGVVGSLVFRIGSVYVLYAWERRWGQA